MNISEIRDSIFDALDSTSLFGTVARTRTTVIDALPAAILNPTSATPAGFADAAWDVTVPIVVLVSRADQPDAWDTIDALMSEETVSDALRASDIPAQVDSYDDIGELTTFGEFSYLSFVINVAVTS